MDKMPTKRVSTKKIVLNGVMTALVFLATIFTRIPGPIPPGYINFGDTVIIIAAILLGKSSGFIAGAFGSALADVIAPGGIIFAPVTFIVKGLEGYLAGKIAGSRHDIFKTENAHLNADEGKSRINEGAEKLAPGKSLLNSSASKKYEKRKIIAVSAGIIVMVAGYFVAELSILRLFDTAFGYSAAISELPFNLIQGGVSAVLGYLLSTLLQKADVERLLN